MARNKVSIVIPAYNEEKNIGRCLNSVLKQSHEEVEIIVVDDGSLDKTISVVMSYKKVKLIKGKHNGPGKARNLGVKHSKGKILCFIDADMVLHKDYIKYLVEPIIKEGVLGTEEDCQIASNKNNIWSQCWGLYSSKHNYKKGQMGNIFRAIRKNDFLRMGGFNPKYGYADDLTFLIEFNIKSTIARKAFCYHKNPSDLSEVYKRSKWIGGSHLSKIWDIPIINYLIIISLYILCIPMIFILSLRQAIKVKRLRIIHYIAIFIIVRYFGTLRGLGIRTNGIMRAK